LSYCLATNCGASQQFAVARLRSDQVFAHTLTIFALEGFDDFALLQSRVHELWARFSSSTFGTGLRYTPTDAFETFAFPDNHCSNPLLEVTGRSYYGYRADLMIRNGEGLTKTYNRFHNPNERSSDIRKLRELHDQMDRAVLDAYGWSDIRPVCEFFPEFEEEEDGDEQESRRSANKKYRYRWPDEIHDEVLARLLALNQERAARGR
jgi:hypothetical protein